MRPILFCRTGVNSDASDGRRDPTHHDLGFGTVIRYSFSAPKTELALTLGAKTPCPARLLVTLAGTTHARSARLCGTEVAAVALPAIAARADEAIRTTQRAHESTKRLYPHENLDGGPRLMRA